MGLPQVWYAGQGGADAYERAACAASKPIAYTGGAVKIKLKDLKPNPFRPTMEWDSSRLEELKSSIKATGFWDGLECREVFTDRYTKENPLVVQLAYGHHRVEAAKQVLGPNHEIEVEPRDISDEDMVRMVGLENSEAYTHCFLTGTVTTVQTVLSAYAAGGIELGKPQESNKKHWRFAGGPSGPPFTASTIAAFLGWERKDGGALDKLKTALRLIHLADEGHFTLESVRGLGRDSVNAALRVAEDERDRVARDRKATVDKAEEERKQHETLAAEATSEKVKQAQEAKVRIAQAKIDKVKEAAARAAAGTATRALDDLREGAITVASITDKVKVEPEPKSGKEIAEAFLRKVEKLFREDATGWAEALAYAKKSPRFAAELNEELGRALSRGKNRRGDL